MKPDYEIEALVTYAAHLIRVGDYLLLRDDGRLLQVDHIGASPSGMNIRFYCGVPFDYDNPRPAEEIVLSYEPDAPIRRAIVTDTDEATCWIASCTCRGAEEHR
jgi:hypothetical protein